MMANKPTVGMVEFGVKGYSEAKWRTQHAIKRNGDFYPTHGVGPLSTMLNINRGNRFVKLISMASQSQGLHNYFVDHGGSDHSNADVEFKLGDVVTTLIKCHNGQTVLLNHDTSSPRPYSLNFRVQGQKGIWMIDNNSIYIEDESPNPHSWESFDNYREKYDHPLWKKYGKKAVDSGHDGCDYFIVRAFVEAVKKGKNPPMGVYDAVSMSVIVPLSEQSISMGNSAVDFPDFIREKWKVTPPIFELQENY